MDEQMDKQTGSSLRHQATIARDLRRFRADEQGRNYLCLFGARKRECCKVVLLMQEGKAFALSSKAKTATSLIDSGQSCSCLRSGSVVTPASFAKKACL